MSEIKRIRKSIARRNKLRQIPTKNVSIKDEIVHSLPEVEEKHGYLPTYQATSPNKEEDRLQNSFLLKAVLSLALFLVVAFFSKVHTDFLATPKKWTRYFLEEDFPFATVHQWYKESFGEPFVFTVRKDQWERDLNNEEDVWPIMGNITESFQVNGAGIMISPEEPSSVYALDNGFVVFAGTDRELGQKIVIQHPDRSKTTYGLLSSMDVHLYQFIEKNQRIGTFDPTKENESVFFSIEKNRQYIDPIQVIKVDDLR